MSSQSELIESDLTQNELTGSDLTQSELIQSDVIESDPTCNIFTNIPTLGGAGVSSCAAPWELIMSVGVVGSPLGGITNAPHKANPHVTYSQILPL